PPRALALDRQTRRAEASCAEVRCYITRMAGTDAARFTVGVFQDLRWAQNGLAALIRAGLLPESLSVVALASPEVTALIQQQLADSPQTLHVAGLGEVVANGPIVRALQGESG